MTLAWHSPRHPSALLPSPAPPWLALVLSCCCSNMKGFQQSTGESICCCHTDSGTCLALVGCFLTIMDLFNTLQKSLKIPAITDYTLLFSYNFYHYTDIQGMYIYNIYDIIIYYLYITCNYIIKLCIIYIIYIYVLHFKLFN